MAVRTGVLLLVASGLIGCQVNRGSGGDGTGTLAVRVAVEMPPAGEPISIGGYAHFVSVGDVVEERIPVDEVLRLDLPAGRHEVTIVTRPQSDTVTIVDGVEQLEVYDISATCEGAVDVPAGGEVRLTYRAIGGNACEVVLDDA